MHGSKVVRSLAGNGNVCEIEFFPEFLDMANLSRQVNNTINASGLDVTLDTRHLEDGILVLMIGAMQTAANAVRNLIFKIIGIMDAQCA